MNKEQVQIDEFYKWLHDHAMTRDDLVRIAEEARAVHAGFKLTRYNQHMYMAKVIEPIWLEVAQRIVEHEVSPAEFVSVVWSMYRDVYVPMLKSVAVANHLLQARIERENDIKLRIRLQSGRLLRWEKEFPERTLEDLLQDPRGQFEPLFIFCIARWQNLPWLAEQYKERALITLCDVVTAKIFAEKFPEAFQVPL